MQKAGKPGVTGLGHRRDTGSCDEFLRQLGEMGNDEKVAAGTLRLSARKILGHKTVQ